MSDPLPAEDLRAAWRKVVLAEIQPGGDFGRLSDQRFEWWEFPVAPTYEDFLWLHAEVKKLRPATRQMVEWHLVRADLAWLVMYVLSTATFVWKTGGVVNPQWIWDRCRDVAEVCDGIVDIWARFHWKSLIKTLGRQIQEVLRDADCTLVTFSHTRPIAKQFLRQIQMEVLGNVKLQHLSFSPAVGTPLLSGAKKDYYSMSLNDGITVPRLTNPKEATWSAFGLVDSLPTSGHWRIRNLDDAVTKDSVTTSEQIEKVAEAWELSQPLGMPDGRSEEWTTGTFYARGDLYHLQVEKRGYKLRVHPCYPIDMAETRWGKNGVPSRLVVDRSAQPVLYTEDQIETFLRKMGAQEGSKSAMMQMFCDPNAGDEQLAFREDWIEFYEEDPLEIARNSNCYLLVDPAREHAQGHDYTAMWVVAAAPDGNLYVVDILRDMLNLAERTRAVFRRVRKFRVKEVRYERYGHQADIEHIEYVQKMEGFRFRIVEVSGMVEKVKRIERLLPYFRDGKFYFPKSLPYRTVAGGETVDLVETFLEEEYLGFPNVTHNDMMDALARICDREGRKNRRLIPLRVTHPDGAMPAEQKGPRVPYRPSKGESGNLSTRGALIA